MLGVSTAVGDIRITVTEATMNSQNVTVTSTQMEQLLEGKSPHQCLAVSTAPSVQVYYALRCRLERSDGAWLEEFLALGGLAGLLEALAQMTQRGFTSFSDAILQLDCIACIRTVLNTQPGMTSFLNAPESAHKLVMALNIDNTLPKKHVLEILSAICAHGAQGYRCVMDALEHFRKEADQTHRLSVVMNELKDAETVQHKTSILTLINSLINCNPDLADRCRLRNEFIGLQLLDVLSFLQKEDSDDDLHLQLQTFYERKHQDEEEISRSSTLDLSSPEDLTATIQDKIFGTAKMASFVNILQDLLAVELHDREERLWGVLERQVEYLVHVAREEDPLRRLSPAAIQEAIEAESQSLACLRTQPGLAAAKMVETNKSQYDNVPASSKELNNLNQLTTAKSAGDKAWVNVGGQGGNFPRLCSTDSNSDPPHGGRSPSHPDSLPLAWLPLPSIPMKNLKWVKVDERSVERSPGCLWSHDSALPRVHVDYSEVERLFQLSKVYEDFDEIPLLSEDTRLRVNLFLNRLDVDSEQLLRSLATGEGDCLTLPVLRYLHRILPDHSEIAMLKAYSGDLLSLGSAEQFLLHLLDVADYRVVVAGHLTRLEFTTSLAKLKTALVAMVSMCRFLLSSADLRDFLLMVLSIGNFINQGQFNGHAAGFKLTSWPRLLELHSSTPCLSLLHFLVQLVEEGDDSVLRFLAEIPALERAASYSPEDIKADVTRMNQQLKNFVQHLSLAEPSVQEMFQAFLEEVKTDFRDMQTTIAELRGLSQRVAEYLCEPDSQFNLQECFQSLLKLFKRIRLCRHENNLFRRQRTMARRRSDHFKLQNKCKKLTLEFGKDAKASSSLLEERKKVLEGILQDLHQGNYRPLDPCPPTTPLVAAATQQQQQPSAAKAVTPTTEVHPLELSCIPLAGTPMTSRPRSEVYDDDFTHTGPPPPQGKFLTSSENDLLDGPPPQAAVRLLRRAPLSPTHRAKAKTHHRSRSDLAESAGGMAKWVRYQEQQQQHCSPVPLAQPESTSTLGPLNLEAQTPRSLPYKEYMSIHEGPMVNPPSPPPPPRAGKARKMEKKTSLSNFFSKISRAVLGPRNTYSCYTQDNTTIIKGEEGGGVSRSQGGRRSRRDKENMVPAPDPPSPVWKKATDRVGAKDRKTKSQPSRALKEKTLN